MPTKQRSPVNAVPTFFNEWEPYCVAWLGNLFPHATVNCGSIGNLKGSQLAGFTRMHLFAGVGGWEYALQLAGWPPDREVLTGSCQCQSYSVAGKGKGNADQRNLWPKMFDLIRERHPECVFGEQVANAIGHGWLDGISDDLEREGYEVGACVLGAHSVGAPHLRQRLYWVAQSAGPRWQATVRGQGQHERHESQQGREGVVGGVGVSSYRRRPEDKTLSRRTATVVGVPVSVGRVAVGDGHAGTDGLRRGDVERQALPQEGRQEAPDGPPDNGNVGVAQGDANFAGPQGRCVLAGNCFCKGNPWAASETVYCRDGYHRRVKPGVCVLAHGVPDRASKLRAYGNAIVVQTAAVFIKAFLEAETETSCQATT